MGWDGMDWMAYLERAFDALPGLESKLKVAVAEVEDVSAAQVGLVGLLVVGNRHLG